MGGPGPPRCQALYHSLAPGFTRVFELEPGKFSDPVVGRLVAQPIDGEPYEALSYVWGDTRRRHDITVDGGTLSVTANLHGALTAVRHRPPPSGSGGDSKDVGITEQAHRPVRRLWADAVCINQEDLLERTSQVELMARIFATARRVLAWLGWERGDADRRHLQAAIRFIRSFMRDPEAGLREARILLLHHDVTGPAGGHLDFLPEDDRRRFQEQAREWEAVKAFFEIEYFHRTWIVQELGLAREAIMYTGLKPASGAADQAVQLDFVDWPLVGRFVKFLDGGGASLVTHLGLLTWVAHHILMVWETREDGTPACDFLTAMHWVRILGVSDARDRVYALLGHPLAVTDGGELVIHPDYTRTRGVVYTRLAAGFIRRTKNLYAVSLVDHEDDPSTEARVWEPRDDGRMPSWVPDWHSINRTTPLHHPVDAAETEDAEIRIDGETEGAEGTPLPHLLVRGWVVDEIAAVSRRMETTDFPVTHLARERAKKNPFWLDRVWTEVTFPAEGSAEDRDALAVLEALSHALSLAVEDEADSRRTPSEHQRSFAAYILEYHELWRRASEAAGGIIHDDNDSDGSLPARSLYDSLPVETQAELRRRGQGSTSEKFIERMTWPSMCRVVYRTRTGLVGMGSRVSRPGDLVCRVRGSPVLMTLRPIGRHDGIDPGIETSGEAGVTLMTGTAPISCVHIAPTAVPERLKRDLVDGREFGERAAHFRIL